MDRLNGGLKDIFSTILNDKKTSGTASDAGAPRIVIHGNGNVIAPGGTVHVVQGMSSLAEQFQAHGSA